MVWRDFMLYIIVVNLLYLILIDCTSELLSYIVRKIKI